MVLRTSPFEAGSSPEICLRALPFSGDPSSPRGIPQGTETLHSSSFIITHRGVPGSVGGPLATTRGAGGGGGMGSASEEAELSALLAAIRATDPARDGRYQIVTRATCGRQRKAIAFVNAGQHPDTRGTMLGH